MKIVQGDGLKGDILYSLGQLYTVREQYDTAMVFFQQAQEQYEKVNDKGKLALVLIEKGKYLDRQHQFQKSNPIYLQSLQFIEENQVGFSKVDVLMALARHYQLQKKHQSAIRIW